jgi:hypothetical protein
LASTKIADVCASDQQDAERRAHENQERSAHGSHGGRLQGYGVNSAASIGVGERLRQPNGNGVELALNRGHSRTRLYPSDGEEVTPAAI